MSLISKTFSTSPGSRFMNAAELYSVSVLGVKREGIGLTQVDPGTLIGDRQFVKTLSGIQVSNTNRFNPGEKIWILYET